MLRTYGLPLLAILGCVLAVFTVRASSQTVVEQKVAQRDAARNAAGSTDGAESTTAPAPLSGPAASPFPHAIAGTGIVEASSDNIDVAAPLAGVVRHVHVKVGADVRAGDPLFTIDDREPLAALETAKARVAEAEAALAQMLAMPRAEDIPAADADVQAATAEARNADRELDRVTRAFERSAASEDELSRARFNVESSRARQAAAEARMAKLRAGAWRPEVAVAEAQLAGAKAEMGARAVHVERYTVRSPIDGRVLVLNVRAGEFVSDSPPTGGTGAPVMVGRVDPLHVRVDIDENEAWRLATGASARVFVRGNPRLAADATFVRVEPYVVPKRSLTGETAERVDTRVLQVIYAFDPRQLPAFVGQQMDVFIQASPAGTSEATTAADAASAGS